jgi:hypothetical protein
VNPNPELVLNLFPLLRFAPLPVSCEVELLLEGVPPPPPPPPPEEEVVEMPESETPLTGLLLDPVLLLIVDPRLDRAGEGGAGREDVRDGSIAEAGEGEWAKIEDVADDGGLAVVVLLLLARDVLRDEIDDAEVR